MERLCADIDVEYVPFWEIDELSRSMLEERGGEHHYTPMSKAKHLYILQDIKRITSRLELTMKWPAAPDNQHWEVPHLAYLYARRKGKGEQFFKSIHEARWNRGEDVCDPRTVAAVAVDCGLDPELTAGALHRDEIRAEGVDELMKACEDGVFGIPFFVYGYNKFWGIDRFELFLRSVRGSDTRDAPDIGNMLPYYETDHPGGCG